MNTKIIFENPAVKLLLGPIYSESFVWKICIHGLFNYWFLSSVFYELKLMTFQSIIIWSQELSFLAVWEAFILITQQVCYFGSSLLTTYYCQWKFCNLFNSPSLQLYSLSYANRTSSCLKQTYMFAHFSVIKIMWNPRVMTKGCNSETLSNRFVD